MNSITSSRRSPPSYFATNDCGRPRLWATSAWVSFAFFRAAMSSSRSFWCWGEWIDLPMSAGKGDDEREKLILFPDYPK